MGYRAGAGVISWIATLCLCACATTQSVPGSVAAAPPACGMTAKEVVENFAGMFYGQKLVRPAFEQWVAEDYIQHKPALPDGREAVIVFLDGLLERYPDRIFTVHRIIAEDDLVAVHYHSQANAEDLGFAVIDIFRVEDCKMVEHWDVVQQVPADSANKNGMF